MYTHARQFPHLRGLDDAQIREIVFRGMNRRPDLIRVRKLRSAAILLGMLLSATLLARYSSLDLGPIFILVGGVSTALVLCWNLVWVNTVLFRVSRDEVERSLA